MTQLACPIFPLNLVLFPGTPQPLHIFEPRYRQMLDDCMAGEMLEFPGGVMGLALNLEQSSIGAVILGSDRGLKDGDPQLAPP